MSFFYINQILWAVQYFLMEFHSQKEHEVQLEKVFSKQLSGGSSSLQTSQLQWSSQKHVNAPSIVLIGHPLDGLGGFNKLFTTCPVILHLLKWFMKKCFVLKRKTTKFVIIKSRFANYLWYFLFHHLKSLHLFCLNHLLNLKWSHEIYWMKFLPCFHITLMMM